MTTDTLHRIQPIDLVAERAEIGEAIEEAVLRVLRSGRYVLGPEVEGFEAEMAALCGVAHGVGVGSGTDALILGLRALGVEAGDEVVTTPFTFFASAATIAWVGAVPRLADVDPETALLDPAGARDALTGKARCIVPVHLYGQLVDMRAFRDIADERGVSILEDGAQAHGARRGDVAPGTLGDACTFSFYVTKNIGAAGEGGLVVSRRDDVAQRLRLLRDHGSPTKYVHTEIGTNSRLQAIQAAILRVKLQHLERWNARRREVAARYDEAFRDAPGVRPLSRVAESVHAYHQYAVRIQCERGRDAVQKELADRQIFAGVHYPQPVHVQEAARPWGYGPGDFPVAEALAREVLCLPIHPFLQDGDVDRVAAAVRELTQG